MGEWLHAHFFVKQAKANLVMGLFSVASGIAFDLGLVWWRTNDESFFLNNCGQVEDMSIRFLAGLSVALVLYFSICGIYNIFARRNRNEAG